MKQVPGAVERACCIIVLCQLLLVFSYGYFAQDAFLKCLEIEYLSLKESPTCDQVTIAMNDVFIIDDSGYWDTAFEWAFADSQLAAAFVVSSSRDKR